MNFVGSGIPREAPDDFLCPACGRNMSEQPIPPVTGLQDFGKYMAAILSGLPLGLLAYSLIMSALGLDSIPGVIPVGLILMLMVMIGSYLGGRLEKMHSVAARWWLLLVVAVLPGGATLAIISLF